jgi:hypothetical protein
MMNLGKKLGLAALLALGTTGAANASVVVLDTFDYTPVVGLEVNSGTGTVSAAHFNINSFDADVEYTLAYVAGALDSSAVSFDDSGDGVLAYSNDTTMLSTLTISYGAFDGTPPGPLDFSNSDAFYFDILSSDLGFNLSVTVGSNGGTDVSNYMTASTSVASLTRDLIDFADFNTVAGAGVDFGAVDFVTILITSVSTGSDLSITEFGITSVPEPTSVAIFGLGLVGFALSRKKAK